MNWEAVGAIGEILGAAAVIATLTYLAMQVQQTKEQLRANTNAILGAGEVSGNENTVKQLTALFTDENLIDIVLRGTKNINDLNNIEHARFSNFCQTGMQLLQVTFLQWRRGLLDDEYWSFCLRYTGKSMLRYPGVQEWWKKNSDVYTSEFRHLIELLIENEGWVDPFKYLTRGDVLK